MNYHELSITVLTNVLFISLFIALFFFTYAVYIENWVVKNQMNFLSEELSSSISILGPTFQNIFKNKINNLPKLDFSEVDEAVNKTNKSVFMKAIYANLFFIIFISGIVYYIYKISDKSFSLKEILIKNAIILVFVGLTEFVFLTYFGSKYLSLNPNIVKYTAINNIKNLLENF